MKVAIPYGDSARFWSAAGLPAPYTHLAGRSPVAQTSSLLYRGFPIRQRCEVCKPCRLEVGDTAGWKPALLPAYKMRVRCSVLRRFSFTLMVFRDAFFQFGSGSD